MRYETTTESITEVVTDCVVLPVWKDGRLGDNAQTLDAALNGALSAVLASGDYVWEGSDDKHLLHNPAGCAAGRVLLVGAGERDKCGPKEAAKFLSQALKAVLARNMPHAHFVLADLAVNDIDINWLAARLAQEAETAAYRYVTTKEDKKRKAVLNRLSVPATSESLEDAMRRGEAIGQGVNRARQLGNLPANVCTPTYLANHARDLANDHKAIEVEVLDEARMKELGMGCFLSVTAGSIEEAYLIVLHYRGADEDTKPVCLVGKGVTFDTGGISIKPSPAMDEMKFDMCGSAAVLGVMSAIANLKMPVNVVGLVAASENMPSGGATKPGDIVTSMSGKTVEILNTDAEGRLLLCDALTYAERFEPSHVIDIATLTGAAIAAFGNEANVVMGNDQPLLDRLLQCGQDCLDRAWQLPLWSEYQKQLDSNFADIANIGGKHAGTITAGCFLSRFTEKFKWAHLDIAGSAWLSNGAAKGATGRPVALLTEFLSTLAETPA